MDAEQKNIVITGGTSGIGLATSKLLRMRGYRIVNVGRSYPCAEDREAFAESLSMDFQDPTAATHLPERLKEIGIVSIQGCFLSAGGGSFKSLREQKVPEAMEILNVNLIAPYLCIQSIAPLVKTGGAIVVCGSAIANEGIGTSGVYAAAKSALHSLVFSLATELGPDIRVNGVAPGAIETPLYHKQRLDLLAIKERISPLIPLRRFGLPHEVAEVVAFLMSPQASYVSGAVIPVHGGGLPNR